MNVVSNVKFLSELTFTNFKEYFSKPYKVFSEHLVEDSIYWYGHATAVINISNSIIVTDPVLTKRLGYFKRIVERPIALEKEKINYIVLSHGHMDHLNFPSLRKIKKENKDVIVIVPKGYKKIFTFLGFKNVVLLREGQVYKDNKIKITALKAEHDGRRFYVGVDNESNSYMIESNNKKIFYAGDTAYTNQFDNLTCDVALMPVGCYMPERFCSMHCSPEESYKMFKRMNCTAMIPIHYKTFKISLENFDETEIRLKKLNDNSLKILNIGQTYKF